MKILGEKQMESKTTRCLEGVKLLDGCWMDNALHVDSLKTNRGMIDGDCSIFDIFFSLKACA